ncbi:MAG TPA: hypothetical protein VE569_12250 [Acidimicrobiia bacterium]|jgi:hypothetical protein|nr:hypothetical protein [Acidimicrobiia bacterium]
MGSQSLKLQSVITRGRRIALRVVVVVTLLAMLVLLGRVLLLALTFWLPISALAAMPFFPEEELRLHLTHGVGTSLVLWTVTIGVGLQLRRPERWLSPLWVAAFYIAVAASIAALAGVFEPIYWVPFLVLVGLALVLHPTRTAPLKIAHRPAALIAATGSVPLLAYAYGQLTLQFGSIATDPHVAGDHYATMAMLAIIIVVGSWLGSTQVPGRTMTALIAGGSAVLLGVASLVRPDQVSAFTPAWAIAATVWGVAYLVVVRWWQAAEPVQSQT